MMVKIYRVKRMKYNAQVFREEDHPRGKDGKFGKGSGLKKKDHDKKAPEKKKKLTTVNPTGGVFVDYKPEDIYNLELGENMTTLAETAGYNPDEKIMVYRGVSTGKGSIGPGDFITTNKQLAQDYAGTGTVVTETVRAGDILDDSDEPLGEEYIYYPEKKVKKQDNKTDTKEFKKWFEGSKIVDKDGKPKKTFHGTNKNIESFDPDKGYSPTDRLGSFFGESKEVAEKRAATYKKAKGGAGEIYEVYLSIKNPIEFESRGDIDEYVAKNMVLPIKELDEINEIMGDLYRESPAGFSGSVEDLKNYDKDKNARMRVNTDILNSGDSFSDDIQEYVRDTMKKYDGIIIKDDQGYGQVFVAFSPEQIKSATDNTGSFDPNSPNIKNASPRKFIYRP